MDERLGQHETPEDVAAAERFAGVLDTLEAGGQPDVDALVDAELASLLRTADAVREPGLGATETVAFHSYRARSRAFVLHTLEQQRVAGLAPSYPAATRAGATQRTGIIDFVVRHRGWTVFAPVAAAAAAAGLVLFTPLALAPEENRPALATNLTSLATGGADVEFARVTTALAELNQRSRNGQPVDASLLRTITESTTAAANRIETQPQSVSKTHVENYQRAIAQSSTVLGTLQAAVGVEDALAAAQRATQDGKVTATRFLGAESAVGASTGNPAAASTATPPSTPAPAPTVAPAAVTTATPTPTATATATATATTRAGTVAP